MLLVKVKIVVDWGGGMKKTIVVFLDSFLADAIFLLFIIAVTSVSFIVSLGLNFGHFFSVCLTEARTFYAELQIGW